MLGRVHFHRHINRLHNEYSLLDHGPTTVFIDLSFSEAFKLARVYSFVLDGALMIHLLHQVKHLAW